MTARSANGSATSTRRAAVMVGSAPRLCPSSCGAVALLLATTTWLGCAPAQVSIAEGPREYVADDYSQVLRAWTRDIELVPFQEADNVLSVTATYESWDFRWAYVVRYADDYRLGLAQRRVLLEKSLAEGRKHHQFYVAMYAQRWAWGDLEAKQPAWVVRLVDDTGNETAPENITSTRKPSAVDVTYFPYTSPWRRVFRIRFPKQHPDGSPTVARDAHWFGLRFAGAQGHRTLVWRLDASEPVEGER